MVLNATPFTIVLFAQSVLLAVSRLDFVTLDVQRGITIGLVVVNAAILFLFKTDTGQAKLNARLIKTDDASQPHG